MLKKFITQNKLLNCKNYSSDMQIMSLNNIELSDKRIMSKFYKQE
jgi:hypothetical protein